MHLYGTAFTLLSLGLLSGCNSGTHVPIAVEAAPQQHSVNRYELHGSPDKVALLVDSETGDVWQYETDGKNPHFVAIPVTNVVPRGPDTIDYVIGSKTYPIPVNLQAEFLKDHPEARLKTPQR